MQKKIIFVTLFLLLIPTLCLAGKAYYVDPKAPTGGNGSYLKPWNSIAQVNAYNFSTSDKLYFRAGTTLLMTAQFTVKWGGTSNDRAVIGAYHVIGGQPVVGLGGNARPVLDGNEWTVPTREGYGAIISHRDRIGYLTIQDLEIRNSGAQGIQLGNTYGVTGLSNTHHIVRNCVIVRPWRQGISVARASYNLIEGNTISNSSYGHNKPNRVGGAGIEITGMHDELSAVHNIVRNNVVFRAAFEGIGAYKQARYTIIEDNVAYDSAVNIYISRSRNQIIRNNLVYCTPNAYRGANQCRNITMVSEVGNLGDYSFEVPIGGNEVYGNYIAGGNSGIEMGVYSDVLIGQKESKIYNNRVVDNNANFKFNRDTTGDWRDNIIRENFSFSYTSGFVHTNRMSPNGVAWENNHHNTTVATVTGNAAASAILNKKMLVKNAGWRNLGPGKITKDDFVFVNEEASSDKTIDQVSNLRVFSKP
jgi:parallel beta-helix repeat protein